MTYEIVGTDRASFVVWGAIELGDHETVFEQVKLRVVLSGRPILFVMRLPSECPIPSPTVREQIYAMMPEFAVHVAQYHVVLEGDGFAAATKRGMLTGLSQFWNRCGVFHVHTTVRQFEQKVPPEWRADATRLLYLAEQRGLLSGPLRPQHHVASSGRWLIAPPTSDSKNHRVA
jgi:hypothetical protein